MNKLVVTIAGLAGLTLLAPASRVGAFAPPQYVLQWGSYGADLGQFKGPSWMAFHAGVVYVTDPYNRRVDTFTTDGTPLGVLYDDSVISPYGIAVAGDGTAYVADEWRSVVVMYSASGVLLGHFGSEGYGDGQFMNPYGVALDSSGNVYVVDRGNNRIEKFAPDGTFLMKWGTFGGGPGEFSSPDDVVVSGGNVYVVDLGNSRIQEFAPDSTFIRQWGSYGSGDGLFNIAQGITADSSSRIYVAERDNSRVQVFDSTGTYLTQWGGSGSGDGQFNECVDAAVDDSGNIYVSDYLNYRVQKFAPLVATGVPRAESPGAPSSFQAGVSPNPSPGAVELRFALPTAGHLRADIYDVTGGLVRHLVDTASMAGENAFSWDGLAESGERVPSGIYFVRGRLETREHGTRTAGGRFVILR